MGFDGFDGVELIMGLEDRLCITIPDRDAERMRTPNDAVDYLAGRLRSPAPSPDARCRGATSFRLGRRRLAEAFGLPPVGLRPSTPTDAVLPPRADVAMRREAWARLSRALKLPLPELRHPPRYSASAAIIGLVTFACFLWLLHLQGPSTLWAAVAGGLATMAVTFGVPASLLFVSREWVAAELPRRYETLGAVISNLSTQTIPTAPASSAGWTRHELWEMVRDLTAQSAGCPPSHVKRDDRWPI